MNRRQPVRTCAGCRKTAAKAALVRIVLRGDALVVDAQRRKPGRGAYVHARTACVEEALHGGLARSFRHRIDPNSLQITDLVVESR